MELNEIIAVHSMSMNYILPRQAQGHTKPNRGQYILDIGIEVQELFEDNLKTLLPSAPDLAVAEGLSNPDEHEYNAA